MFPRNQARAAIGLMNIFASCGSIVGTMTVGYFARGASPASNFYILGCALFAGSFVMLLLIAWNSRREIDPTGGVAYH
ncbi:hypothetical protein [Paraburkholderia sp. BCC1886]|uniref:hypothetical protein n=1 Tax=Paraburkholderia sp. BCC1886 TaxID=2562670 RepID=UPI00118210B6|nr:hypothetical protein [Paraburkholderia sp. BCC1886]